MPALAPLRNCAECGKPIGRRWAEYVKCGQCVREVMEKDFRESHPELDGIAKDDIPYLG